MTADGAGPARALYELVVENVRSGTTPGDRQQPPARYEIQHRETTIGRSPRCTIRLDDMFVSRRHARLILRDLELHLEDLESTNQSRVNGAPVPTRVRIHPGDVLLFGGARCRIESFDETGATDGTAAPSGAEQTADAGDAAATARAGAMSPEAAGAEGPAGHETEPWPPARPPRLYVAGPLPGEPRRTRLRVLLVVLISAAVLAAASLLLR